MATHQLPHMGEAELEAFLADHTGELGLTSEDAQCFRIRRRRRSLEMATSTSAGGNDSPSRALALQNQSGFSIGRQHQQGGSNVLGSGPFRFVKCLSLGDDCDGKFDLASMFYTFGDAPVANPRPDLARRPITSSVIDIQSRTLSVATPVRDSTGSSLNTTATWRCELWMPSTDNVSREIRTEAMHGAHAIIVSFSTRDRKSFDAAASIWLPEAIKYARGAGSKGNGCEVPIILVGTNAEVRNQHKQMQAEGLAPPPVAAANVVPASEAIQLAQDSGAAKYVEVYSGNAFHVRELFVQVVQASVNARVIAGVPDTFLWKRHRVHCKVNEEFFRSPAPEGFFHAWSGQFLLTNVEGGASTNANAAANNTSPLSKPNANTAASAAAGGVGVGRASSVASAASSSSSSSSSLLSSTGVVAFGTLDGSDPGASDTSFAIRGPLDILTQLQQSSSSSNSKRTGSSGDVGFNNIGGDNSNAKVLRVMTKRRGYFNSHTVDFTLPKTTPSPHGYVDVSSKMLHLFASSLKKSFVKTQDRRNNRRDGGQERERDFKRGEKDYLAISQMSAWDNNNEGGRSGDDAEGEEDFYHAGASHDHAVVEIRYTLDGSEPNENSPVFLAPIALDTGLVGGNTPLYSSSNHNAAAAMMAGASGGKIFNEPMLPWSTRGATPPTEVRAIAVAAGCFRSEIAKVEIPDVLPAPRANFNPVDGTFRIEGGTTTPGVEFRFTTDGSIPCGHSQLYSRPVLLKRTGADAVLSVRVAAFPKLSLPSVALTVNVAESKSGSLSARNAAAVADLARIPQSNANDAAIPMNRAALLSKAYHHRQRVGNFDQDHHPTLSAGSKDAQATSLDKLSKPFARRTNSPMTRASNSSKDSSRQGSRTNSPATRRSGSASARNKNAAAASGDGGGEEEKPSNVVAFDFPKPIKLFYLTATTPGETKGPKAYRVLVKDSENPTLGYRPVAEGLLEDYAGIQTLPLPADSRMIKIGAVRCEFGDAPQYPGDAPVNAKFQLLDLKVHGNAWEAAVPAPASQPGQQQPNLGGTFNSGSSPTASSSPPRQPGADSRSGSQVKQAPPPPKNAPPRKTPSNSSGNPSRSSSMGAPTN